MLEFCFQKVSTTGTHILKIHGLQYDMNMCLSALLVWAQLWFLSYRNTFIVKIEIKKKKKKTITTVWT